MIVIYLYGEDVYQNVSIQNCISHFQYIDEAIQAIEERLNLKFQREPTISHFGYRVYDLDGSTRKIRLIAETVSLIK